MSGDVRQFVTGGCFGSVVMSLVMPLGLAMSTVAVLIKGR